LKQVNETKEHHTTVYMNLILDLLYKEGLISDKRVVVDGGEYVRIGNSYVPPLEGEPKITIQYD
jgi:hypothetical protein